MWSVEAPPLTAGDVARACVLGTRNDDVGARLLLQVERCANNSLGFVAVAQAGDTWRLDRRAFILPGLSDEDMLWLYGRRLVVTGSGRRAYDQLRNNSTQGLCSYCQYRPVSALDHFVPKSMVASLALEPYNLVPSCADCNQLLGASVAGEADSELFNPFVTPALGRWLFAAVDEGWPAAVSFFARPDPSLPAVIQRRIVNQFSLLRLGELYSLISVAELTQVSQMARMLATPEVVRQHLADMAVAAKRASGENVRRGVMYEALAASDWYVNGGYV